MCNDLHLLKILITFSTTRKYSDDSLHACRTGDPQGCFKIKTFESAINKQNSTKFSKISKSLEKLTVS